MVDTEEFVIDNSLSEQVWRFWTDYYNERENNNRENNNENNNRENNHGNNNNDI